MTLPKDPRPPTTHARAAEAPSVAEVQEALSNVVDPELGADIVDLGMVRSIEVDGSSVRVEVALTIAGCPLRDQLRRDVERHVGAVPGIASVEVRTGVMSGPERSALMDRARSLAQDRAVLTDIPDSARVLAISSGKGGVGKSSVTVNLAVALARRSNVVGILDADVWGHSVPRLLGMSGEMQAEGRKMIPLEHKVAPGLLKVISMGFLSGEDDAIMWRGLVLNRAVQHFLEDVRWGELDYLLVDMPPGTGDVQMGIARMLPRSEVLIVTTPNDAAAKVAGRAADMARKGHLRVAGVIENMAPFVGEHGENYSIFGEGGGQRLADRLGVPLIGSVPLDPAVATGGDEGDPVAARVARPLAAVFDELARSLECHVAPRLEMAGCSARMLDDIEQALGPPPGH